MKVAVAQLGARRHYLVPRVMNVVGLLERFYTDIYATAGWLRFARSLPRMLQRGSIRRLAERVPMGIDPNQITVFTRFAMEYKWQCRTARDPSELTAAWLWGGQRFCELVLKYGLANANAVYAFNSAALELLREARHRGLTTILDQTIAPRTIERRILEEELERWPGWEKRPQRNEYLDQYCAREQEEWEAADLIVCGSEFVKEGIAGCGGPVDRCEIIPFAVDSIFTAQKRPRHADPLRVLFVGTVCLRKGVQYIMQAAKRTKGTAVFRMAGPISLTPRAEAELREHVELTGDVPRSQILEHYRWADVFLFPSLCEGSANAIYEALATGLPVICTPNAGSVVREGVDGYIVPPRNAEVLRERIEMLRENTTLLRALARNAVALAASESNFNSYSSRFLLTITRANKKLDDHGPPPFTNLN